MSSASILENEDTLTYLREHNVADLFEYLLREIVNNKPENPAAYLHDFLKKPIPPKIVIAGPPAGGKGTQCEAIVEKYGVVHISSGDLLRAEVRANTELGKQAQSYMSTGQLVPDSLISALIRARLEKEDVKQRGWLLDGYPRTAVQAQALEAADIIPRVVVQLDVDDELVYERMEGRRTDPATGKTYHVKYNPPPQADAALLERLEQRADDTRDALEPRLHSYHENLKTLTEFYRPVLIRVDGSRDKTLVSDDIVSEIGRRIFK